MTGFETIFREDILARRLAWFDYLEMPERKKAKGVLDAGDEHRCCLGHGACSLGIPAVVYDDESDEDLTTDHETAVRVTSKARFSYEHDTTIAPSLMVRALGLNGPNGEALRGLDLRAFPNHTMMTSVNDETDLTPQQIGAALRTMVNGGDDTPFKPLTNYEVRPVTA